MKPIKVSTDSGIVTVHSATMKRASGYGQYHIIMDVQYHEHRKELKHHLTDSQLFDLLSDMDNDYDRASHISRTYLAKQMIEEWLTEIE